MTRRLLFVTYEFPPMGGPGVQRPLKLVRYLIESGWDATVITVADPPTALIDKSLLTELPSCASVRPVWSLEPTRLVQAVHRWRTKRALGTEGSDEASGARSSAGFSGMPLWFVRLVQAFFVPDEKRLWVGRAVREGLRAIREDGCVAIVSSGPPHSAHIIAARLSRRTRLPFVVDFRDPWVDNFFFRPATPLHAWLNRRLERRVVQQACKVVSVTDAMTRAVRERHPNLPADRFITITNGFDPADLPTESAQETRGGRMTIVHTGTFSGPRTPAPLLRGLTDAFELEPAARAGIEVLFFGGGVEFKPLAEELGLGASVTFKGYVPHAESVFALASADVALLLLSSGAESAMLHSGKVFEYLGLGKPVLAVVGPGMAADLVQDLSAGRVASPEDAGAIGAAILGMFHDWEAGALRGASAAAVQRFSRPAIASAFADILDECARRG